MSRVRAQPDRGSGGSARRLLVVCAVIFPSCAPTPPRSDSPPPATALRPAAEPAPPCDLTPAYRGPDYDPCRVQAQLHFIHKHHGATDLSNWRREHPAEVLRMSHRYGDDSWRVVISRDVARYWRDLDASTSIHVPRKRAYDQVIVENAVRDLERGLIQEQQLSERHRTLLARLARLKQDIDSGTAASTMIAHLLADKFQRTMNSLCGFTLTDGAVLKKWPVPLPETLDVSLLDRMNDRVPMSAETLRVVYQDGKRKKRPVDFGTTMYRIMLFDGVARDDPRLAPFQHIMARHYLEEIMHLFQAALPVRDSSPGINVVSPTLRAYLLTRDDAWLKANASWLAALHEVDVYYSFFEAGLKVHGFEIDAYGARIEFFRDLLPNTPELLRGRSVDDFFLSPPEWRRRDPG